MRFEGPLPAALTLDSLADQIGDPIIRVIESLPISPESKKKAKSDVESILVDVFASPERDVRALRDYLYELHRRAEELNEEYRKLDLFNEEYRRPE